MSRRGILTVFLRRTDILSDPCGFSRALTPWLFLLALSLPAHRPAMAVPILLVTSPVAAQYYPLAAGIVRGIVRRNGRAAVTPARYLLRCLHTDCGTIGRSPPTQTNRQVRARSVLATRGNSGKCRRKLDVHLIQAHLSRREIAGCRHQE